jgi:hypothetical protein
MGDEYRPDRCHVVLSETPRGLLAQCDPLYPDAWREGGIAGLLALHAQHGHPVYVQCGKNHFVVGKLGAYLIPREWIVDDGMVQQFQVPVEILRQVGWGPLDKINSLRRAWH